MRAGATRYKTLAPDGYRCCFFCSRRVSIQGAGEGVANSGLRQSQRPAAMGKWKDKFKAKHGRDPDEQEVLEHQQKMLKKFEEALASKAYMPASLGGEGSQLDSFLIRIEAG